MYDDVFTKDVNTILKTPLQWFTFYNFYSQKNNESKPESWQEAVTRATENLRYLSNNKLTEEDYKEIAQSIYELKVVPSMRLFSMPLEAIKRCNSVIYNCSFIAIDNFDAIAEMLYLSMSGVGIGYTVEHKAIDKLPVLPDFLFGDDEVFVVPDTQAGWADSVKHLFKSVENGIYPQFDYSKIRPAGAPLKTKGGVASGPEPLKMYHEHVMRIIEHALGRQLKSIEVHDIVNMVSECAISNGSRTGALICLFDNSDTDMLNAKSDPNWLDTHKWRSYSNNSIVVNGTTDQVIDEVVQRLIYDASGEPGLFSPKKFYETGRVSHDGYVGINPCGEVLLRNKQFCNLSTVILDEETVNSSEELLNRLRVATLIGTIQSMADHFDYLSDTWQFNTQEERLLGVSITGIYDYKDHFNSGTLNVMKQFVQVMNESYAGDLGINPSTSVTSIKPSGNTSVLTNTSPGVNPDFGRYQIRNIRVGKHTPMARFLLEKGVPYFDDPNQTNDSRYIFMFPFEGHSNNTLETTNLEEQLENHMLWSNYYTTHNPSVTITYQPEEKDALAQWIKDNYQNVTGMAFWQAYDQTQSYLPVQVVTEQQFKELMDIYPDIDWTEYPNFVGNTHVTVKVLECAGDRCDVVFG